MVVRELTGGIYFGEPRVEGNERAVDTMVYTRPEVERIAHVAFRLARQTAQGHLGGQGQRAGLLAGFGGERSCDVALDYPDVTLEHLLVDAATMSPDAASPGFRRRTDRQHVRRHPERRDLGAGGFDGHAAFGLVG